MVIVSPLLRESKVGAQDATVFREIRDFIPSLTKKISEILPLPSGLLVIINNEKKLL